MYPSGILLHHFRSMMILLHLRYYSKVIRISIITGSFFTEFLSLGSEKNSPIKAKTIVKNNHISLNGNDKREKKEIISVGKSISSILDEKYKSVSS